MHQLGARLTSSEIEKKMSRVWMSRSLHILIQTSLEAKKNVIQAMYFSHLKVKADLHAKYHFLR